MAKNRNLTESQLANLKTDAGPGRPKGQRNFATIYRDALIKLAEKNSLDPDQLETEILERALLSARKGDHRFYKDLMDRLYGQATQKMEETLKIEIETISPEDRIVLLSLLNDKASSS